MKVIYERTGEWRKVHRGEWYEGYNVAMPLQNMNDFDLSPAWILRRREIEEGEDEKE